MDLPPGGEVLQQALNISMKISEAIPSTGAFGGKRFSELDRSS